MIHFVHLFLVLPVLGRMLRDAMAKWHIAGGDWFHRQPPLPTVNGLRSTGPRTPKNRKKKPAKEGDESGGPSTPQSATNDAVETTPIKENGIDGYVNGDSLDADHVTEPGDRGNRTTRLLDCGRLLRLSETRMSADDLHMFQTHWQSSMPVLVTRPRSWFRADIWRPATLARCGGSPAVDGVTGVDVPAARFWDQFEHGLKSASGLRLKDWPCPDDLLAFTAHLRDLDEHLPLPEYTRTAGPLHLVSHVPEYFVRPELSVLRLHAGQSSTVCGQVAPLTKLRVDAVDNVSAVVYVAEKDNESHKHGSYNILDVTVFFHAKFYLLFAHVFVCKIALANKSCMRVCSCVLLACCCSVIIKQYDMQFIYVPVYF